MDDLISSNGKIVSSADSSMSAFSSAALYGKGVFTTAAIYDGKPFLWEKHLRRLSRNAEKLGIDLSELPDEKIKAALNELLEKNSVIRGRARITFFDAAASSIWPVETGQKTLMMIMTGGMREASHAVRLTVSPFRVNSTSPLAGVKSCNYMENILALDEAKKRGFDEAIRLNERGQVVSAAMANIFWLKDEKLFTPSLKTGCLAGTIREFVLESMECVELEAGIEAVASADAIFLTSAGIGIAQAAGFEERELNTAANASPIYQIMAKFGDR